jgi:hypothetical protein
MSPTILSILLQMQADDLCNVASVRGSLKFGRRKSNKRQSMEGHAMLHADYFANNNASV